MQLLRSPARPQSIRFRDAEVSTFNATGLHYSCGKLDAVFKHICARIGESTIGYLAPLPLRILRSREIRSQLANQQNNYAPSAPDAAEAAPGFHGR